MDNPLLLDDIVELSCPGQESLEQTTTAEFIPSKGLKEFSMPLGKIGNSGSMPVTAAGQMLAGLV